MWQLAAAVCLWVAVVVKAARLRRSPSRAGRTLLAMLAFPTVAATAVAPPVYRWLDEVSGVSNTGTLIASAAGLLGVVPCFNTLAHARLDAAGVRVLACRRYALAAALVVVQAVLWTRVTPTATDPMYALTGAQDAAALVVLLLHQLAIAFGGLVCVVVSWRLARERSGPLRLGLLAMVAAGAGATLLVALNVVYYGSVQLGGPVRSSGVVLVSLYAVYGALVCLAVGVLLPDVGPGLLHRREVKRHLRALEPVWRNLVAESPDVKLPKNYPRWSVERRLHRRVVETHDAAVELTRHTTSTPAAEVSKAGAVAAAIRREVLSRGEAAGGDLLAEVRFLLAAAAKAQARGSSLGQSVTAARSAALATVGQE